MLYKPLKNSGIDLQNESSRIEDTFSLKEINTG